MFGKMDEPVGSNGVETALPIGFNWLGVVVEPPGFDSNWFCCLETVSTVGDDGGGVPSISIVPCQLLKLITEDD